jgi:KDO2-lipid IV(A) lauroyltransferase
MSIWSVQTRKKFDRLSLRWMTRLLWLATRIMPYHPGVWLGGLLGNVAYLVLRRERTRALKHLSLIFRDKGDAWVRRTARKCFVHLGKSLFEVMLADPARLSQVVDFPGREIVHKALEQGKGVVYVTGHIGNWELMGSAVAATCPLSVVAAPIEPAEVNDLLVDLRGRLGYKTILRGRPGAAKELIRIFKENRVLGILIDQDTDVEGAFVDFMGRPAWTPTAAAQMAIKFSAPVLFGYIHRGKDNRHTVTVEGPLELIRTGDQEKDIVTNTALLTKKLEECILRNPEQWVWMHRRWRRQP